MHFYTTATVGIGFTTRSSRIRASGPIEPVQVQVNSDGSSHDSTPSPDGLTDKIRTPRFPVTGKSRYDSSP